MRVGYKKPRENGGPLGGIFYPNLTHMVVSYNILRLEIIQGILKHFYTTK